MHGQQNVKKKVVLLVITASVVKLFVDRDSSVGIATRYGLDGPGIIIR